MRLAAATGRFSQVLSLMSKISTTGRELSQKLSTPFKRVKPPRQLVYGFVLQYKLLTVLDLGNVRFGSGTYPLDLVMIAELEHLQYLAIRLYGNELPEEIGNLQKLGDFCSNWSNWYHPGNGICLEFKLFGASLIRSRFFQFPTLQQKQFFYNYSRKDNMKSISSLLLRRGSDVEKFILRKFHGIQKLGCKFFANSWDEFAGSSTFPELHYLTELKSLKIFFDGKVRCACKFSFPSNLTKLSMSNSQLPWNQISVIGKMVRNLEVLKLLNKAFQGQKWFTGTGEFPKLKFLKLESLDVDEWDVSDSDHLPSLEQLVIVNCEKLEEIPSSVGEISTLKLIEMKWCSSSAMASATQILELQRDLSNDHLRVNLIGCGEPNMDEELSIGHTEIVRLRGLDIETIAQVYTV
ncbi:OLC1v1000903C1 [Oldenlandia corymbosa var. corymbosa]|uniref:OLC1v1000903C1 n=1 Tax=Oldenlandia corymbosa var. corymbosa TaxID=529605 RepID=A0AAV1D4T8_OLDCO|nr:OLC1v1000903C1 [Oldenlandia corymbosa var. corymbosa]